MSEFKWDDDLVNEMVYRYCKLYVPKGELNWHQAIEKFKQSKLKTINDKREWEIIECYGDDIGVSHNYISKKDVDAVGGETCDQMGCKIKSVRRISDNTLWSVNDLSTQGQIKSFYVSQWSSEMFVVFESGELGATFRLEDLQKPKKPLFITEDGKAIYEGDRCRFVGKDFEIDFYDFSVYENRDDLSHYPQLHKYFSTEAAAKEYIAKHKPKPYIVFTQPTYGSEMYVPYDYGNVVPEGVFKRFETKELAREFCVMNKPCLSINNVMDNCTYIDSQCAVYFANFQVKLKELVEKKLSK